MKILRFFLKSRRFFLLSVFVLACETRALAQTATNTLTVEIVNPTNDSVFYTPTNILLIAKVNDPDGSVSNVEFFAGTNDLGPGEPIVLDPPGVNGTTGLVYLFNWTNVPVGSNALTAVATDNSGDSAVSPEVDITVLQGPPPPAFPTVRIVSPPNGSVFYAPVDVPLFAYVNGVNPFYYTIDVVFYDGTNIIGCGQPIPSPVPVAPGGSSPSNSVPPIYPTNLFFLAWSNAPVGNHVLTAHAVVAGKIDALAFMIDSPPVDITVLPPQPPPTNRPAIVDIVATDPIAVAGTNSWAWSGETNSPPTWTAWPAATCCTFTNFGPKTVTFTVRRCGETNDDLTVAYSIGGTASNGVDYVALPGYVTIPAAERRAFINIIPINGISPDVIKTVILTLTPSTNTPPDYLVGYPPRAAAIIIDSPGICPAASMTSDQCFRLSMPGPDAAWFCVQRSADMINWTPVCTNQVVNGSMNFIDPDASANVNQFYRIVPISNAPAE